MRYLISTVLLLSLSACAASPQSVSPSASPGPSTSPTASPAASPAPAASAQPAASPAAAAQAANGATVELSHAITVKKDGVPLKIASLSTRTLKDTSLRFEFGMKNGYLPAGEYGIVFGYDTKGKSPVADGLQISDLELNGLVVVTLYEGTGAIPKRYVGKPRSTPTTKALSLSDGKLSFDFKGELVPYPGINPDPSFVLELEIKAAPLM